MPQDYFAPSRNAMAQAGQSMIAANQIRRQNAMDQRQVTQDQQAFARQEVQDQQAAQESKQEQLDQATVMSQRILAAPPEMQPKLYDLVNQKFGQGQGPAWDQGGREATAKYAALAEQVEPKSSPLTDTDDYVTDAALARAGDKEAGLRNVDRLAIKRAQPAEVAATRAARSSVDLKFKPAIQSAVKLAEEAARAKGETLTTLARAEAALPGLIDTIDTLKELAPIATSTFGGKLFDTAVKESGFGSTKGATARAKFIAIVMNQVLPLLKPTFGAAFTVEEGKELKATMGDPDASPAEKIAQLEAFIVQKRRSIETAQREVSTVPSPPQGNEVQEGQIIVNKTTGQRLQVVNGKLVGVQ